MRWVATLLSVAGGLGCAALGRHWLAQASRNTDWGVLGSDRSDIQVAAAVMLAACFAGILGAALAYNKQGRHAAVVLLVGGLAPGLLDPRAFVVTCVLVLAGILSLDLHFTRCPRPRSRGRSVASLG